MTKTKEAIKMGRLTLTLTIVGSLFLISTGSMAGEIYRWIDKDGNVFFSDSPPPYGSFKKQNIEDEVDKSIDQKKVLEKRSDINDKEKLDQRIKIEIDYQKKAKAIRDYQAMREELETLREKYQNKHDELRRQWNRNSPGSAARHDINKEAEKLRRDYEKEVREIRKLYGYY